MFGFSCKKKKKNQKIWQQLATSWCRVAPLEWEWILGPALPTLRLSLWASELAPRAYASSDDTKWNPKDQGLAFIGQPHVRLCRMVQFTRIVLVSSLMASPFHSQSPGCHGELYRCSDPLPAPVPPGWPQGSYTQSPQKEGHLLSTQLPNLRISNF